MEHLQEQLGSQRGHIKELHLSLAKLTDELESVAAEAAGANRPQEVTPEQRARIEAHVRSQLREEIEVELRHELANEFARVQEKFSALRDLMQTAQQEGLPPPPSAQPPPQAFY